MTWIELEKETGWTVSEAIVVASLAARIFTWHGTEWSGIHWMKMEDDMELMELWIEKVRGFDEMRAWHKDLLSVQKNMEIERWLVLVDVHNSVDSMAAASSSKELVNNLFLDSMVVTTWDWSGDPLVTNVAAAPFLSLY